MYYAELSLALLLLPSPQQTTSYTYSCVPITYFGFNVTVAFAAMYVIYYWLLLILSSEFPMFTQTNARERARKSALNLNIYYISIVSLFAVTFKLRPHCLWP